MGLIFGLLIITPIGIRPHQKGVSNGVVIGMRVKHMGLMSLGSTWGVPRVAELHEIKGERTNLGAGKFSASLQIEFFVKIYGESKKYLFAHVGKTSTIHSNPITAHYREKEIENMKYNT